MPYFRIEVAFDNILQSLKSFDELFANILAYEAFVDYLAYLDGGNDIVSFLHDTDTFVAIPYPRTEGKRVLPNL